MVYIGITCLSPDKRWCHGEGYRNNKHFYRAICKYGWNNFNHEILYHDLTKEEAEQKEIELIAFYSATDKTRGYNKANGGNHQGKHTLETRQKISKSKIGFRFSEESKIKMSLNHADFTGENNPRYGVVMSSETKAKISQKAIGRLHKDESKRKMSIQKQGEDNAMYGKTHTKQAREKIAKALGHQVKCLETGLIYPSEIEAKRQTGIDNSSIQRCCKGKQSYAGKLEDGTKLHWQYI